jgi:hypothetical protein
MSPSISALDRARRTLLWSIFGLIQAYAWPNRSRKYWNQLLGYPTWLNNCWFHETANMKRFMYLCLRLLSIEFMLETE